MQYIFTEQGSSASHMTTAKVLDVVSRLPGCAGQGADAVSALHLQVKMEEAPECLKIPKSECPDIWIRPPRHKWPKSWSSMEDLVVPLERNLYGHPLAGLLWERQFEKVLLEHGWEKVRIGSSLCGFDYNVTDCQKLVTKFKNWSFFLNGMYVDTHQQDCSGKAIRKGLDKKRIGEGTCFGVSFVVHRQQGLSPCTWTTSRWLGRKKFGPRVEQIDETS